MQKQNTLILCVLVLFIFLLIQCSQLKNCGSKCKNATRDCLILAYAYTAPFTLASSATTSPTTDSLGTLGEAEPNDTFATSYNSRVDDFITNVYTGNYLQSSNKNSYVNTAIISSSNDLDIFFAYLTSSNISLSIYQKSGLNAVTCKLYSRDIVTTYKAQNSTIDSTFTFLGTLDTKYYYAARKDILIAFFILCSGTAGTAYSIQTDPYDPNASNNSLTTGPINVFNYSTFASCAGEDANCRKTCSTKL